MRGKWSFYQAIQSGTVLQYGEGGEYGDYRPLFQRVELWVQLQFIFAKLLSTMIEKCVVEKGDTVVIVVNGVVTKHSLHVLDKLLGHCFLVFN